MKTVQQGYYTRDIAKLTEGKDHVERSKFLNTFEFIDKVASRFESILVHGEVDEEVDLTLSTS